MKKKKKQQQPAADRAGFEHLPDAVDFYSGGPKDLPLSGGRHRADVGQIRKTERHQAMGARPKETIDIRDRMALITILKTVFMILLLVVAFAMLWKGIKIYEESVWLENHAEAEVSPVMREVAMVEDFDISADQGREQFAERIETWKESERLVAAAGALLQRNNYDEAILRCQDALRLDPAHTRALDLLGRLYYAKGMYVEAVNAYIRLLSVDPSQEEVQKRLIESLGQVNDHEAVRYMAEWYQEENLYDIDVQRQLAHALFVGENYEQAAKAFGRVLQESPADVYALEQQAKAYLKLEQFEEALKPLSRLRELNYRNAGYYHELAACNAQLGRGHETVQVLGRAAQLFGDKVVMSWVQDPRLDKVRDDRMFNAFMEHVGGEGFRQWLQKMAKSIENADGQESDVGAMLDQPEQIGTPDIKLLNRPE